MVYLKQLHIAITVQSSSCTSQLRHVSAGQEYVVTFKKKFVEPTAETDTLATVGLENEYEPIIMAGVAAQMMAGRDIPAATTDYITDQLAVSNFPS